VNAYRVFIKTTPYGDGIAVPAASDLPAGAVFNGAIDNNLANTLTGGSSTNGYLAVTAGNNSDNTNVNFGIKVNYCYKPAITNTNINIPAQHGITALSRAGANENWPMIRQSAWTVMESKERGFVINRVLGTSAIINPEIGMMVYDISAQCLKIYAVKEGNSTPDWYCFTTPACPD